MYVQGVTESDSLLVMKYQGPCTKDLISLLPRGKRAFPVSFIRVDVHTLMKSWSANQIIIIVRVWYQLLYSFFEGHHS